MCQMKWLFFNGVRMLTTNTSKVISIFVCKGTTFFLKIRK